jgi:hypothetical protein
MDWMLRIFETIGGLEGIRKVFSGKKTYLTAVAGILAGFGYAVWRVYQWTDHQIDVGTLVNDLQVVLPLVWAAVLFIFNRMGTAKAERASLAMMESLKKNGLLVPVPPNPADEPDDGK